MSEDQETQVNHFIEDLYGDEIVFRVVKQGDGQFREEVRRVGANSLLYFERHAEPPSKTAMLQDYESWYKKRGGK